MRTRDGAGLACQDVQHGVDVGGVTFQFEHFLNAKGISNITWGTMGIIFHHGKAS